jgi:hypothetical protein
MQSCSRCGGQVLSNYEEVSCLQCGWEPEVESVMVGSVRISLVTATELGLEIRENLSDKPSQIRRRRRRLLKAGYSESETERIIRLQIDTK